MANKHFFYVLPLLTLLSVSPAELLKHKPSRSIASVESEEVTNNKPQSKEETSNKPEVKPEEKKFERFEEMISKVDPSNLLISQSITKESLKTKSHDLQSKIQKDLESFNKDASDKEEIKKQRESIESLIVDKVILDKEFDVLDEKKELDEELRKELLLLSESQKDGIENLLIALEKNEELLDVEAPRIADSEESSDKPENSKPEDTKPEEPKVTENSKPKEDTCAASEQVKILTTQVEKLMEEQNLILQAMLNLTQAMVNMSQNMQQQQPYFPMPQTAYQYNAPMAQGNWVYYPQGMMGNQGFYPNQAYMPQQQNQSMMMNQPQQNNWSLQPSQNFQFQNQMMTQQMMPQQMSQMPVGQFGMDSQASAPMTSFNFTSANMPSIGML